MCQLLKICGFSGLCCSGISSSVDWWQVTDVSGQRIRSIFEGHAVNIGTAIGSEMPTILDNLSGPIFKGQAVEEESWGYYW
jgi:hypothetical protein